MIRNEVAVGKSCQTFMNKRDGFIYTELIRILP